VPDPFTAPSERALNTSEILETWKLADPIEFGQRLERLERCVALEPLEQLPVSIERLERSETVERLELRKPGAVLRRFSERESAIIIKRRDPPPPKERTLAEILSAGFMPNARHGGGLCPACMSDPLSAPARGSITFA
jgi:hypothetical protein